MDIDTGAESPWGDVQSQSDQKDSQTKNSEPDASNAQGPALDPASSSNGTPLPSRLKSPAGRGPRTPKRLEAHTTRLEAIDDSLGPLGPLGDNSEPGTLSPSDQGPVPPTKETPPRSLRDVASTSQTSATRDTLNATDVEDDLEALSRARLPPPVRPAAASPSQSHRQNQPSVPIEQAAKPSFEITVGDPHKVGDLTSSHIEYQVRTKTTSKAYRQPEFSVSRRYRDFLWLYNQLHSNNPGVIAPPPPEKQIVGKFESEFVESRRAALERMLNKAAAHPILQHDGDLKLFLESDAFNVDVKHKEKKEPGLGESKGVLSSIGLSGGSSGKFIEHDDWFHDRKIYLDALENQLKALLKAIDVVVKQRKELADAAGDFSVSLHSLSTVELSPLLSGPLAGLSDLQLRIREVYERQAQQDILTLGITVDEYIRLIGSVKQAFSQRQKAFHSWHAAESEFQKRRTTQDKTLRQGRTQQDRLNQLSADVSDAERKVHQARLLFDDMGRLMRNELDRFEKEKVEDFKSGVETFLESAVEAQKELIELWETYLMQLDADDDEQPPLYKMSGVAPSSAPAADVDDRPRPDVSSSHAAATATADQED